MDTRHSINYLLSKRWDLFEKIPNRRLAVLSRVAKWNQQHQYQSLRFSQDQAFNNINIIEHLFDHRQLKWKNCIQLCTPLNFVLHQWISFLSVFQPPNRYRKMNRKQNQIFIQHERWEWWGLYASKNDIFRPLFQRWRSFHPVKSQSS